MIEEKQLRKLATNGATYQKALECFRLGHVISLALLNEGKRKLLTAFVEDGPTYKVELVLDVRQEQVESYKCSCPKSRAYPGMCEHSLATLLQNENQEVNSLAKGLNINQKDEQTQNIRLESLLQHYSQVQYQAYEEPDIKASIQLVPSFVYHAAGGIGIRFAIGTENLYQVKDLYELGKCFLYQKTKEYAKGVVIKHDLEKVASSMKSLATLVIDYAEQGNKFEIDPEEIQLSERMFNRFFNKHKQWGEPVEWVSINPEVAFSLEEEGDNFKLQLKEGLGTQLKSLYEGAYLYGDNKVYKVDNTFIRKVWPILKVLLEEAHHTLVFAKTDTPKVKRYLLDAIREYVETSVSEETMAPYVLPDLVSDIHLDLKNEDSITAKVSYQYGEEIFNPYEAPARDEMRDVLKESYIEGLLQNYGFNLQKGVYLLKGEEKLYRFVTEGVDKLMPFCDVYISDRLKQTKVRRVKTVSVGIHLEGDWLAIDLSCIGIPRGELGKLLQAYQVKRKYYRLKNGEFVDLTGEGMQDLERITEGLSLTDKELEKEELLIPKYRALYLERLLKDEKTIKPTRGNDFKKLVSDFDELQGTDAKLPEHLKNVLRAYQVEGHNWMKMLGHYGFGGILADDMGIGKTLQMLSVLNTEVGEGTSLIVCPTSLVFNWVSECEKFSPELKIMTITGNQSEREQKLKEAEGYDLIITSYELLKRDSDKYEGMQFNYCVIDEAQYIKNSNTQNAKTVKAITCKKRMALTGTPIENRLSELWSLFDFIMPGYLFSEHHFRNKIETPILKDEDEEAMARLKKMIAPFILRRLKKEVLEELPDKIETTLFTELLGGQYKVYMSYAIRAKEELLQQIAVDGVEKSHIKMLACLTRLRQICCHPSLFIEDYKGESGKLKTCLELVENTVASGHKILLFSQFTTMLDVIASKLKEAGISYSLLKGDVKAEKRRELVEQFNEGDTNVFLISLKAGGVGLNLTGADVVIHYDPWWNVSAQNQATDRAYRMGQRNNVQVFKLITKGTIEEKIKQMQDKKQDLTENVLSAGHTMINQLSKEEILALFDC